MRKEIENYFIGQYEELPSAELRMVRLLFYFVSTSVIFCFIYYLNTFLNGFLTARYLMLFFVMWFSLLIVFIKVGFSFKVIAHLYIFTCWIGLVVLSLFSDGIRSYVLPWLVLVPMMALILTSYRFTWIWVIVCIVTVLGFYFTEGKIDLPEKWVATTDSVLIVSLHLGLILLTLWLTYIFEANQRSFVKKIEKQNDELVAIDEELRQSLEELSTTQELLAEKEAESRSIVEALREHFHITEFDTEGNILYANQKVFDMTRSNPIALNRFQQMDPAMRDSRIKEWNKIVDGASSSGESLYEVKGHQFWVMSTYAPIQNRLGKVSKILSVAHEITETKKREAEISEVNEKLSKALDEIKKMNNLLEERVHERTIALEEKNKYLAEYAFINSHLLRGPLCRLLGLIQLLNYTDVSKADAELLRYLRMAGEEIDSVVERINLAIEKGSYFDRDIISGNLKSI